MNKIEITVLSARVLDALSGRGLKAKTVHEFERYGTRRIVKHCLGKGQILYSKETVQNFVWQERAKQESGTLPHYQWGITRRAAVYLDQMAEYGKIQDEPIRPWETEHNPLFQAISCNPSNSMKVIDIICRTRDEPLSLRVKQGVVTAVGVFVDLAVPYAFKSSGTSQSLTKTADAGEHIHELNQGHNSRWGCLPNLRSCLIGAPHQKQKQPVIGCTKQDFFTVHNV